MTKFDLHYNEDTLFEFMSDLPNDVSNYTKCKYIGDNGLYWKLESNQKSMRIKLDPDILNDYPDVKLGSIISKSEPSLIIVPTNEIVEYLEESTFVENLDLNLFSMSKTYISVQNLLTDYLHSKLYNIPIKQIRYQAKWLSGHITDLDVRSICDYQTPFEQASNMKNEIFYGVSIDVSNVAKRSDLVDLLRYLLIEYVAKNIRIADTTISVEFGDRIIVKVEPFYKKIQNEDNTLYIHAEVGEKPEIHNFTKQKWNQLYSK